MSAKSRLWTRDLTIFGIGALSVLVFSTSTAVAVATSKVTVTDSKTGVKASVTGRHSLAVSERDPRNGHYAQVDGSGAQLVRTLPSKLWNTLDGEFLNGSSGLAMLAQVNKPGQVALSSLTLDATGSAGTVQLQVSAYIADSTAGSCTSLSGANFTIAERFNVSVQTGTTAHFTWPVPLVWSAYGGPGSKLCVDIQSTSGPSGWGVSVTANGFYV